MANNKDIEKKFRIEYCEDSKSQMFESDHGGKKVKLVIDSGLNERDVKITGPVSARPHDKLATITAAKPQPPKAPEIPKTYKKPDSKLQPEVRYFSSGSDVKLPLPKAAPVAGGALGPAKKYHHEYCRVCSDMQDFCEDCLAMYREVTGITKFKNASTPFMPDRSLGAADEELCGQFGEDALRF